MSAWKGYYPKAGGSEVLVVGVRELGGFGLGGGVTPGL